MIFAPLPKCSQTAFFSFSFIIYMSLRIQSEKISSDEFAQAIMSDDNDSDHGSLANAQELVALPADTELFLL